MRVAHPPPTDYNRYRSVMRPLKTYHQLLRTTFVPSFKPNLELAFSILSFDAILRPVNIIFKTWDCRTRLWIDRVSESLELSQQLGREKERHWKKKNRDQDITYSSSLSSSQETRALINDELLLLLLLKSRSFLVSISFALFFSFHPSCLSSASLKNSQMIFFLIFHLGCKLSTPPPMAPRYFSRPQPMDWVSLSGHRQKRELGCLEIFVFWSDTCRLYSWLVKF